MLKVGDKLVAKNKLLLRYGIEAEDREFQIEEFENGHMQLQNKKGFKYAFPFSEEQLHENFYVINKLNSLIQTMIDKEEIKSFSAVTVDGKVINIELT
ncbi:hypothetical protein [Priestia megaterium]|uniref:hypothetical protein n=1 Tax=Priestia megaterium TaxID=1404 RepID=UPI0011269C74|nr:hypothetical protein [Priestia megaterium]TPF18059.1 hypothetical protein CBE78_02190 [Priestia megaterium]TPF22166.1 hypothetical protein CBE79_04695 [Priestia megaterium]